MAQEYHPGEIAVQEQAGVRRQAGRIAGSMHDSVPPVAQAFLEQRRFVRVLSTRRSAPAALGFDSVRQCGIRADDR